MTFDEFHVGMSRLEKLFNGGVELGEDLRGEYFEALKYVHPDVYREAVQVVVDTFRPFMSEPFPAISTIESAIMETRDRAGEEAGWEQRRQRAPNTRAADYCQRCDNGGLYLGDDGHAHLCVCEKGRVKRASWGIPAVTRKRDEKIQKALEKLPPSPGPVRGIKEWNPLGFWEDTQEKHDLWMEVRRAEIEEIKRRRAEEPQPPALPDEFRKKLLKDTVAGLQKRVAAPANREPGEDEEEEEIPF